MKLPILLMITLAACLEPSPVATSEQEVTTCTSSGSRAICFPTDPESAQQCAAACGNILAECIDYTPQWYRWCAQHPFSQDCNPITGLPDFPTNCALGDPAISGGTSDPVVPAPPG